MAEATDLKSVECSFKSSHGDRTKCKHGHVFDCVQRSGLRAGRKICIRCRSRRKKEWGKRHPEKLKLWRSKSRRRVISQDKICVECQGPRPARASKHCDFCANDRRDLLSRLNLLRPNKKYIEQKTVVSLDKELIKHFTLYNIIASGSAPSPLDELIWKEESEERRKFEKYHERKHRPILVYRPHDFEEERIGKLAASAPSKSGRRGKLRGGPISKFSPERGITQRHIKMSPQQFV